MVKIDKNSPIPLYFQLSEAIKTEYINNLDFTGEKLLPFAELMQKYGVSLTTVNKAVNVLIKEGLLFSEHGRGTFIKSKQRTSLTRDIKNIILIKDIVFFNCIRQN